MRAPLALHLALVILAASCNGPAYMVTDPEVRTYANPVATPVAADPSVLRAPDGTYYLFATQDDWADGSGDHLLPIFSSDDLISWTFVGDVFEEPPAWKASGYLWAPDVARRGGGYSLYYAYSLWGDPDPCLGLATAPHPEGPWSDLGRPVFCSDEIGVPNSIDPFVWEEGGELTMIWGSFHGIYAVPLNVDGTQPAGEKVLLADSRFEAPYVHRRDGYYYLFLSSGSCCEGAASTYAVYVGRSAALGGPYVDRGGRDLRAGGGERILAANATWAGPGHTAVVTDDAGADWLFYHAIPRDNPRLTNGVNRRPALLDPIAWQDGWPVINGGTGPSSAEQAAPEVQ